MKTIGIVLVVAGVLALIYGGIGYTRHRNVMDMGPMQITTTEHRSFPIPVTAGVVVLVGGLLLLVGGNRRSRSQ